LESRLKELTEEYKTALSATTSPIEERRAALRASKAWCSPEAFARDAAISREVNHAYDALCAGWWKEGGAFHTWLAEFKQFQIELAAQNDEYADAMRGNYEMMGIPSDQYRPTGYLNAPIEYLNRAAGVFSGRNYGPVSEEPIRSCSDHG